MTDDQIRIALKRIRDGISTINYSIRISNDTGEQLEYYVGNAITKIASSLWDLDEHFATYKPWLRGESEDME